MFFFFIRASNFGAEAERSYIFLRFEAENVLKIHGHTWYTYILFDGFTYNTRGYCASCVIFFRARGKIRAMSKMSAGIICKTIE